MSERNTISRGLHTLSVPLAATTLVEAGKMAVIDADGYGAEGSTATGLKYLGRWEETVDNAGADGALSAIATIDRALLWANSSTDPITQADVMTRCYIQDDQTVARTSGTNTRSAAGLVLEVTAAGVWVAPAFTFVA